jgi:hypothetical protein
MKEMFVIYHNADGSTDEPEKTRFEYNIGEIITVNNYGNQYKCIFKDVSDNKIIHHFKQGKKIYTFDY